MPLCSIHSLRVFATSVIVVLLLATGCTRQDGDRPGADETRSPLILFGIDGLEWSVMRPLLADGRLPHIAALMQRGTYGDLASMRPTYSPVIWTSIATGKVPKDHGIRGYVYKTKRQGKIEQRYYTSGHRETKAFWNILSDYGRVVHCIGWWITYPAEPVNGVMVAQTNTTAVLHQPSNALWKGTLLKGVQGQVHPPERQNQVMDILEATDGSLDRITAEIFGEPPHPLDGFAQIMWDQTQWAFRADATYIRVAEDILKGGEPFDVMAVYIGGTDVAGHRFWRYAYPNEFKHPPSGEQIENFHTLIDDYYVYVDQAIGAILQEAPEDAGVMIVSDHGMHATNADQPFATDNTPQEMNSGHHEDGPPGVFIAAGGRFRSNASAATSGARLQMPRLRTIGGIMDVAPTLLALEGVPIGEDMFGRPIESVIDPEWLKQHPIRSTPSHDTEAWLASRQARIRDAVAQTERLEQLRSLGYIK
jgi:hypothetical protein